MSCGGSGRALCYPVQVAKLDPITFIREHGVVLASARGPVPNLAEAVAGEPIRGGWWAHAKGRDIFRALGMVSESDDVLTFRLVDAKITFVHRRLWPALVRLADELPAAALCAIRQEHTQSGAHRNLLTPFPEWAPEKARTAARELSLDDARAQLGAALPSATRTARSRPGQRPPSRARTRSAARKRK
jgi:hypothetical protein